MSVVYRMLLGSMYGERTHGIGAPDGLRIASRVLGYGLMWEAGALYAMARREAARERRRAYALAEARR